MFNLNTKKLLMIILLLGAVIYFICKSGKSISGFGKSGGSTEAMSEKPKIGKDTVLIFYADWCGHCKDAKPVFEKARSENSKIVLINSDENKDLVEQFNIKGFPTIIKGDGTKYQSGRTVKGITNFADGIEE
jgi:thiol-disulfide isomerase/thioredoxin